MEEGQRHCYTYLSCQRLCLNPCCNGRGSKTRDGQSSPLSRAQVLILVVMEEGQRPLTTLACLVQLLVLILVVMEEGQRLLHRPAGIHRITGLNPCCNGRGSKTSTKLFQALQRVSLNPCCNGRGSKTVSFCMVLS